MKAKGAAHLMRQGLQPLKSDLAISIDATQRDSVGRVRKGPGATSTFSDRVELTVPLPVWMVTRLPLNEASELTWERSVMPWEAPESHMRNKSSAGTLPGAPEASSSRSMFLVHSAAFFMADVTPLSDSLRYVLSWAQLCISLSDHAPLPSGDLNQDFLFAFSMEYTLRGLFE